MITNPTGIAWLDPLIALGCIFLPSVILLLVTRKKGD